MADRSSGAVGRRPPDIDTETAHAARVYDYLLGGTCYFAVDREAAERVTAATGGIERSRARIRANRRFLVRAVRYLAEAGARQFLDLGTGIPGPDNVHEVARSVAPEARVVYVDNDPIVLAHAHALPAAPEGATAYVDADVTDVDDVLAQAAGSLDLDAPVAVLMISLLHLVPDDDAVEALVERYVSRLVPGSHLALTHLADTEEMTRVARAVTDSSSMAYTLTPRSLPAVAGLFDGLDLVEPGVVLVDRWRPDGAAPPGDHPFYGAVGRVP